MRKQFPQQQTRSTRPRTPDASGAIQTLERRTLFAAAIPELLAVPDIQTGTSRSATIGAIAFYDVTDIRSAGNDPFQTTPLFSIWSGYEITNAGAAGRDFEEQTGFGVSPDGRTGYMLAFDSPAVTDGNQVSVYGDTNSDYDLYKFDIALAYNDFITNNRPRGIMYAPRYSVDYRPGNEVNSGIDYVETYSVANGYPLGQTGLPSVTSADAGIPRLRVDGSVVIRDNTDAIGSNDIIFLDGVTKKVGEVARPNTPPGTNSTSFFNQQDLKVLDDNTILFIQQAQVDSATTGTLQQDFSIRTIERVSNTAGASTFDATNNSGGFNQQTSESWKSVQWSGDNYINLDNIPAGGSGGITDVDGMRYVNRDGVKGIWVSDRDGGGDELAFFSLDFATHTATKRQVVELGQAPAVSIRLDENPNTSNPADYSSILTNDGDIDGFDLDANYNLVIRESNFVSGGTSTEGKPITIEITDYSGGTDGTQVIVGQERTLAQYVTTTDDDAGTINTQYGIYDPYTGLLYNFDTDGTGDGAAPTPNPDAYVYDLATQTFILQKLNIAAHFLQDGNFNQIFRLLPAGGDTVAPVASGAAFSFSGSGQSLAVTFSEDVSASLAAGDFTLVNLTTGATIPASSIAVAYNTTTNVATLTFANVAGANSTNALATGRYRLSIGSAGVTDAAGNALTTFTPFNFGFKVGDADGDFDVDFADLLTLAKNYNGQNKTFAQGDFDYDHDVDFADLLTLAKNYNTKLAPAPAAATSATATPTRKRATSDVLA